jgi:hypothetical protein
MVGQFEQGFTLSLSACVRRLLGAEATAAALRRLARPHRNGGLNIRLLAGVGGTKPQPEDLAEHRRSRNAAEFFGDSLRRFAGDPEFFQQSHVVIAPRLDAHRLTPSFNSLTVT